MLYVIERIYLQGKQERVNDNRRRNENSFGPVYNSELWNLSTSYHQFLQRCAMKDPSNSHPLVLMCHFHDLIWIMFISLSVI